jgi:hypothetical protein
MNKATKACTRSKPVKKASAALASAVKPVKKRSKVSAAVKTVKTRVKRPAVRLPVADENGWKPEIVPLAEVEVLAAAAVKMIKAKRSASPEEKARKLDMVADKLEKAKGWGGLSKSGAWVLKHPFGICQIIDLEAVLR